MGHSFDDVGYRRSSRRAGQVTGIAAFDQSCRERRDFAATHNTTLNPTCRRDQPRGTGAFYAGGAISSHRATVRRSTGGRRCAHDGRTGAARTGVSCRPASLVGCGFGEDVRTKDLLGPTPWPMAGRAALFPKHLWNPKTPLDLRQPSGWRPSCAMAFTLAHGRRDRATPSIRVATVCMSRCIWG
jgi:hypothetical protein